MLDILRRPARERFGLILSELGMGLAARGDDLQTTIRRGVPALRETDRVLEILAANRQTLQRLTARRRPRARRPGRATATTSRASSPRPATRRPASAAARRPSSPRACASCRRFLRELRPTLRDLGTAAAKQTPALADLRAAAPQLTTLLRRLGPFADAARPGGPRARRGVDDRQRRRPRGGARPSRSCATSARVSTEPMRNLRFVLEDVNDRDRAVEPNRLSPGNGAGFTGLEALLQYFFTQSQSMNIYDSKSYILKIGILLNECSQYTNAKTAREHPERTANCKQWLGPNQPGVTTGAVARTRGRRASAGPSTRPESEAPPLAPPAGPGRPGRRTAAATATAAAAAAAPLPDPGGVLEDLLPGLTDSLPGLGPGKRSSRAAEASERTLLDYLLGP